MSCLANSPQTVSIWISAHGYQPVSQEEQTISMRTRSQNEIKYDGTIKVFQLSMAGLANVVTEAGIIYKNFKKLKQTGDFLTPEIVKKLQDRSTEYATLTWLVRKIYNNQYNKCQENIVNLKLQELEKEILILEKLASIYYSRFSLPTIIPMPMFNKVYSLKPNPNENIRREGNFRSNPIRTMGNPKHNKLWAFYGLYILDTSDPEHAFFSISNPNLPVNEYGLVDPREIIKRNLLTQENYNIFWKYHLDNRDFSGVPDSHVSNMGDDIEASIDIFKNFCEAIGIVNPTSIETVVIPPDIIGSYIVILRAAVKTAIDKIITSIRQLQGSADNVSDASAECKRAADLVYKAEKKYNELTTRASTTATTTRLLSKTSESALDELKIAKDIWQEANEALRIAKETDEIANQNAKQIENSTFEDIIAAIKTCIDDIISSSKERGVLQRILKNIIMSNKLKNILKTAIFYKKISLNQIILFFRGLEYKELGIADPACCVTKPQNDMSEVDKIIQFDTQELENSSFVMPPLYQNFLDFIEKNFYPLMASAPSISDKHSNATMGSASIASIAPSVAGPWSGGKKRKKLVRVYSRKRRVRRRRYTRRKPLSRILK
jgi:hypothetical protein